MKKLFFTALLGACVTAAAARGVVEWKISLKDKGNGEVELTAVADIQAGWHLYDVSIPEGGPNPTELDLSTLAGATRVGKFKAVAGELHKVQDEVFKMEVGYYEKTAIFVQRLRVTDKAAFKAAGEVSGQACSSTECTPPIYGEFSFSTKDLPADFKAYDPAKKPAAKPAGAPAKGGTKPTASTGATAKPAAK